MRTKKTRNPGPEPSPGAVVRLGEAFVIRVEARRNCTEVAIRTTERTPMAGPPGGGVYVIQ